MRELSQKSRLCLLANRGSDPHGHKLWEVTERLRLRWVMWFVDGTLQRNLWHVQPGESPKEDLGHGGEILSLDCPGNTSVVQKRWRSGLVRLLLLQPSQWIDRWYFQRKNYTNNE